ncbi:hypothetical protein D3C73_943980 [compost metagenome]
MIGQHDAAIGAHEQRGTQALLQPANLFGQPALRYVQRTGSRPDAAVLDDGQEGLELVQSHSVYAENLWLS